MSKLIDSGGYRSLDLDQKTCVNGGSFPLNPQNLYFWVLNTPDLQRDDLRRDKPLLQNVQGIPTGSGKRVTPGTTPGSRDPETRISGTYEVSTKDYGRLLTVIDGY